MAGAAVWERLGCWEAGRLGCWDAGRRGSWEVLGFYPHNIFQLTGFQALASPLPSLLDTIQELFQALRILHIMDFYILVCRDGFFEQPCQNVFGTDFHKGIYAGF